jgi:hypothetical protein
VQISCDTKEVVSVTVQTDLSSHTANEVKMSDGEQKRVAYSQLEKMGKLQFVSSLLFLAAQHRKRNAFEYYWSAI